MGYFPFFADIENSRWLIVGGGAVAFRKTCELLPFGVRIRVVSPEICRSFVNLEKEETWGDRIRLEKRDFEERDLDNIQFAVAATSSPELNRQVGALCRHRGIPVNASDSKGECSFLFPSVIKDGPVTLGISTEGTSPALARLLKLRLSASLPPGVGALAEQLGGVRAQVKELYPHSPKIRSAVYGRLAREGLDNGCSLTPEMIHEIINRKLEDEHD
ncbi:MAG: bifunctional precorrin-2 dehydrogenase/sirohydrochlorin ferrochelatase [Clostridium sp.]|nr:bifunctional precorrin-2 dehydrogenase/sirohydrochlorin ferrochelatase [Clostridium sp.]